MRSQAQFVWAVAVAVGGFAMFRAVRELPTLSRLTVGLAVATALVGLWPSAEQFVRIDACLDSGGRWNYDGLQCER